METLSGDAGLELLEFEKPPVDPVRLLGRWLASAEARGVREPRAMALATVSADGLPSNRIALVKEVEPAVVFSSSAASRKGRDLAAVPHAAGTFYWRETLQQVQVAGAVERMSDAESDSLFAARPRMAQAASIASAQGKPLEDPQRLQGAAAELAGGDEPLRRPADWCGYRLIPDAIEFWHGSPDRLHRRLLYVRGADAWTHRRLQP